MRTIPTHIIDLWNAGGPAIGSNGASHGRVTVDKDWFLTAAYDAAVSWTELAYDDTVWGPITTITTVGSAQTTWPIHWAGDFPNDTAEICWASDGSIDNALAGTCYFRWHVAASPGVRQLYVTADNTTDVWVDGVFLGNCPGFTSTTDFSVTLSGSEHVIAMKATNYYQSSTNPAGVAWALYNVFTLLAHSDATGVMLQYLKRDPEVTYRIGNYDKAPVRWWQDAANDQVETEVPNIEVIDTDRSIDQDAATCKITLSNQWHLINGDIALNDGELGQPGYFSFSRGESSDSLSRWGQTENDWNEVLVPEALLRTYEGYGGKDKTIAQALTDGNIVLTGVWLIDSVRIGTSGKVEISCRDMGKLLVEQQIYPPLVPTNEYPVQYDRWGDLNLSSQATRLVVAAPDLIGAATTQPILLGGCTNYGGNVPQPDFPDYYGNEPGNGYWLMVNDGTIYSFGNNVNYGQVTTDYHTNAAIDIESTLFGHGYWVLYRNGTVHAFGEAVNYGSGSDPNTWAFARNYLGDGYWIMNWNGQVTSHGSAVYHGGIYLPSPGLLTGNTLAVDITGDPVGDGYWILTADGRVFAFGSAVNYGQPASADFNPRGATIGSHVGLYAHPSGGGYWTTDQVGNVYSFGKCQYHGQLAGQAYAALGGNLPFANQDFPDFISDLIPTPSGKGYWLIGVSGGAYPFGDAIGLGALNSPYEAHLRIDGNYRDYADIVKDVALWSGFWLKETLSITDAPSVYGNIETTGAFGSDKLDVSLFDKQPVISPLTKLKEVVGYLLWVDEEGALHFESPNIFEKGNFDEVGNHVDTIPSIDEAIQLTDYTVEYNDKSSRSEIIVSTTDPTDALDDTITTRVTPSTSALLRGIIKPAMWVNGVFTVKHEQEIMAELIALYIWLAQRQGSVTCMANPAIQINDQVRIWERVTSETYIHYVRGVSTHLDLVSGEYMMTLTTHWMGDDSIWAVDLGRVPFNFGGSYAVRPLTYTHASNDLAGDLDPTLTTDGNQVTAWIEHGSDDQLVNNAVAFTEYAVNNTINRAAVYPTGIRAAGGTVWISVMVAGVWQGSGSIPYHPVRLPGELNGVNTPSIPYVSTQSITNETPVIITLPATYDAQRVRITITGSADSDWGPLNYEMGLREVEVGLQ